MSESPPTTGAAGAVPDSPAGRDGVESSLQLGSPAVATTGPPGHTTATVVPSGPLTEAELVRGREQVASVKFPPAWTADVAGRYLASTVEALVTAERVDPLRLVDELRSTFAVYTALAERRPR